MDMKSFENLPIPENVYLDPEAIIKRAALFCKISKKLGRDPYEFADYLLSEFNGFINDFFKKEANMEKCGQGGRGGDRGGGLLGGAGQAISGVAQAAATTVSTGADILSRAFSFLAIAAPLAAAAGVGYMLAQSESVNTEALDKYVQSELEKKEYERLAQEVQKAKRKNEAS